MPKPLAFSTVRFQPGEAMLWGCSLSLARMVLWSSAWLLGYSWWGWCTTACVWPEYGESVSRTVSLGEVQAELSAVLKPPNREGGLCPQRLWGPTYKNSPSPSWAEAATPRFPCSWHLKWDRQAQSLIISEITEAALATATAEAANAPWILIIFSGQCLHSSITDPFRWALRDGLGRMREWCLLGLSGSPQGGREE